MKMVWTLKGVKPLPYLGYFYWGERLGYPTPMAGIRMAKLFRTKHEAEEWLFQKHVRKGRDVSFVRPARVHVKTLAREGINITP